jgi:rubredoxin
MSGPDSDPVCPKCGGAAVFEDKNTFTGRIMREYRCQSCRYLLIQDEGEALWQVLHDDNCARAEAERLRAKKPWWKLWGK